MALHVIPAATHCLHHCAEALSELEGGRLTLQPAACRCHLTRKGTRTPYPAYPAPGQNIHFQGKWTAKRGPNTSSRSNAAWCCTKVITARAAVGFAAPGHQARPQGVWTASLPPPWCSSGLHDEHHSQASCGARGTRTAGFTFQAQGEPAGHEQVHDGGQVLACLRPEGRAAGLQGEGGAADAAARCPSCRVLKYEQIGA